MQSPLSGVEIDIPILIVDDFSTMRKIVRTCLHQLGFNNIIEADDGINAIAKMNQNDFKLIISDWKMPNMMGIDLLKAARADDKYKSTPFVMITAEALKENMMDALDAGASNYLVKPVTAEILLEKIGEAFKLSSQIK